MRIAAAIQNLFGFSLELTRNPQPGDVVRFKPRIALAYPVCREPMFVLEVMGTQAGSQCLRLLKADGKEVYDAADSFEIVQRKQP